MSINFLAHSGVPLKTHYQVFTQHSTLYLLQPDQNFLMKVKVEDLEGLGGQSRAGQKTGL